MNWNFNCRKTRRLLALWAGNDLGQRECQSAERHLAVCPACREIWTQLQQSQQVLDSVRSAPLEEREQAAARPSASAWPWVSRHLRAMSDKPANFNRVASSWKGGANWRDWLPVGAVAAACVVIISVSLSEVPTDETVSPSLIRSSPAAFESNPRHLGPFPLGLWHERRIQPDDNEPMSL